MKEFARRLSLYALILVLPFASQLAFAEDPPKPASGESTGKEIEADPGDPSADEAAAATTAAPSRRGIEEIVIQAGESESAADFEAGDSVAAFDASDLEALGAQSIEDLAAFTPNLEIVTSGSTTPTFFIRGVGLNDFNANSSGAVAVYQNDVPLNSPALQLGTLFDVEAVNILRGPQGVGPYRNASAGAIKVYSRKPSGEFGGYLNSTFGNYNAMDFEGAVEAPVYEDILAVRFAFRVSERDGYVENGCGDAVPIDERGVSRTLGFGITDKFDANGDPLSLCGESIRWVPFQDGPLGAKSAVAEDLPTKLNDLGNWSGRGTLLFQPTLDMEWLLTAQGGRRDEQSRLGQPAGTGGLHFDQECLLALDPDVLEMGRAADLRPCQQLKWLGAPDAGLYQADEVKQRLAALDPCRLIDADGQLQFVPLTECSKGVRTLSKSKSEEALSEELASQVDSDPYHIDVNRVGKTKNDVWGVSLKGDMVLGESVSMQTVSGYNTYDRTIDVDLDFSPNQLFEFVTTDNGWQFTQDMSLSGYISEEYPIRWEIGGFFLMEQLNVQVDNFFDPKIAAFAVAKRNYTQDLLSAAGYASLAWDFWDNFTLDGGYRYNWEHKTIDYNLFQPSFPDAPTIDYKDRIWEAPTGTVRLTYRFREDTHAYWKYTRGWKGGHFNATGSLRLLVTEAEPEQIDAFEAGLRGSWFGGRLGANFSTFYYNYENYQIFTAIQVLGTPPEFVVLNASSAEVYGAELDLIARPVPGLYLQARLSWLQSQFLDYTQLNQTKTNGITFTSEVQNTGNPLLNSPKYKVSLTAEQTIPLGRFGTVTARWDGAWTDATNYDATNSMGVPNITNDQFLPESTIGQSAFWLHNVRLAYRTPSGSLEVAGWVRNVADEVYKTFAFDGSQFQDTTIYFIGEPRTYGVSVTTTF